MLKSNANQVSNNQHRRVMELKYKKKCDAAKRQISDFVLMNAALADEIAIMHEELIQARKERRYLLQRLLRYEPPESPENPTQKPKQQKQRKLQQSAAVAADKDQNQTGTPIPKKRGPKKRSAGDPNQPSTPNSKKLLKQAQKTQDKIVLDQDGKPMFPINLCTILIHSLGEIAPYNSFFQSTHWVYPVGYVATRVYAHPKFPLRKCVYTCKILNNGGKPQFQIIPDNDLENVYWGESANDCHRKLLEKLQQHLADVVKVPMLVQGEQFFGLSHPDIKLLLKMDPGFQLCIDFKGFLEPDAAADTITEENDPTLSYEALQSLLNMSTYHTMPEPRDQPPDELLNFK